MKKLIWHPLSWVSLAAFFLMLLFLLWPDTTDTGEATEPEEVKTDQRLREELEAEQESDLDTLLKIAPEPRDKTEETVDTLPDHRQ